MLSGQEYFNSAGPHKNDNWVLSIFQNLKLIKNAINRVDGL